MEKKRSERKKKKQISSGDWEASLNRVREQKRADKVKGNDIEAVESQKGQCKCPVEKTSRRKKRTSQGNGKSSTRKGHDKVEENGTKVAQSSKQADANLKRKDELQ